MSIHPGSSLFRSSIFLSVCSICLSSSSYGPPVSVKVGSPALLACSSPYYGDVRWTLSTHPEELLVAACKQKVCVEGHAFENRSKVNQENTSLLLDPVVYSDTGWYICYCNGSVLCEVHLDVFAPITISVSPGEKVTLPCFTRTDKSNSRNDALVWWEKDGQLVVNLQQGKLSYGLDFEKRASVSASGYKHGDLSLIISTFGSSDEGVYRCYYANKDLGYPEAVILAASPSEEECPAWSPWSYLLFWISPPLLALLFIAVFLRMWHRRRSQRQRAEVNLLLTNNYCDTPFVLCCGTSVNFN